jgi:hypothetical protein
VEIKQDKTTRASTFMAHLDNGIVSVSILKRIVKLMTAVPIPYAIAQLMVQCITTGDSEGHNISFGSLLGPYCVWVVENHLRLAPVLCNNSMGTNLATCAPIKISKCGPLTRSPSQKMALSVGFIRFASSANAIPAKGS